MSLETNIRLGMERLALLIKGKADISYVNDLIALKTGPATIMKTTNMTIIDSREELPNTPLADRKSIVIYNKSTSTTLYIGDSTVLDTKGTPILPGKKEAYDIDSGIYGVCASGETCDITINELS